jgi:hypothetical protein
MKLRGQQPLWRTKRYFFSLTPFEGENPQLLSLQMTLRDFLPRMLLCSFSILALLTACTNNNFRIKGVYTAPESGFRLEVIAWGNLDETNALSGFGEYDAHFLPLPGKTQGEAFHFEWRYPDKTDPAKYTLTLVKKNGKQVYDDSVLEDILEDTLYALGYETQETYEVQEAIFAVYGAASGPDATVLPGQAKFLEVVEVELDYKGD